MRSLAMLALVCSLLTSPALAKVEDSPPSIDDLISVRNHVVLTDADRKAIATTCETLPGGWTADIQDNKRRSIACECATGLLPLYTPRQLAIKYAAVQGWVGARIRRYCHYTALHAELP